MGVVWRHVVHDQRNEVIVTIPVDIRFSRFQRQVAFVACRKQIVSGHVTMVTSFDIVQRKLALAVVTRDCRIVRRLLGRRERMHRHVASEYVACLLYTS